MNRNRKRRKNEETTAHSPCSLVSFILKTVSYCFNGGFLEQPVYLSQAISQWPVPGHGHYYLEQPVYLSQAISQWPVPGHGHYYLEQPVCQSQAISQWPVPGHGH